MGIELKNPVIVGASNMVTDIDKVKRMEDAGASAIVYKTLFEEQIQLENLQLEEEMSEYSERNAEMLRLFPNLEHAGPQEHLYHLQKAREAVNIPIIASLNCIYDETWTEYAKMIQETGVHALELNFYTTPQDYDRDARTIIAEQVEIVSQVRKVVNIPISVKLSPFYVNVLNVCSQMYAEGADGFVLFNRLFQPDIDPDTEKHFYNYSLSNADDNKLAMRFAGILHGNMRGYICSSGGIYTGNDAIKMILAGADSIQVVSTLYQNGIGQITTILNEIKEWMEKKNYKNIDAFRGKLSKKNTKDPFTYKRSQYVDILMKSEEIFKKYPVR
jgi:dihydroorotate dehydrogenase (fumarate)